MSNVHSIISAASWEDRFRLGMERLLGMRKCEQIVVLYSDEYATWTEEHRIVVQGMCAKNDARFTPGLIFGSDPSRTWNETLLPVFSEIPLGSEVIVDVSTMPREVIWHVFWFLVYRRCSIQYVYNRPKKYGEWLSREPDRPRLVLKMSGISKMGARTALLVLAGYDVDRVRHVIDTFEPSVTLLGLQRQNVDPQNEQWMKDQEAAFKGNKSIHQFEVDAYMRDCGMADITAAITPYLQTHNILLASMGPKLSAISLFELQSRDDSLGLVYCPALEFNRNYSQGIGDSIWGSLPL